MFLSYCSVLILYVEFYICGIVRKSLKLVAEFRDLKF